MPILDPVLPAIMVIAWDRPKALQYLLQSLARATYPKGEIPLLIGIDGGGDPQVRQFAEDFEWTHGPKELLVQNKNWGLVKHILCCGDQVDRYGALIMLEDDLEVAPGFYSWAIEALTFSADQARIIGVSLYAHKIAESASWYAFECLPEGDSDVYYLSYPVSWGQAFWREDWETFRQWLKSQQGKLEGAPAYSHRWGRETWKRDLLRYMLEQKLYFLCPKEALSSNRGLPGVHFGEKDDRYGVPLSEQRAGWRLIPPEASINRFDAWFEPEPECLRSLAPQLPEDLVIDLYGCKSQAECEAQGQMVLSSYPVRNPDHVWQAEEYPRWLGVLAGKKGRGAWLGPVKNLQKGLWGKIKRRL